MIKYEELALQLKNRQFSPVYLLMGEEPFYIDQICKFFENNVMEEADRDFNQAVLFGKDNSAADVIANVKQFPFGSPYRLVIVKEAKELRDFDQLAEYAKNPVQSSILVVCYKYGKTKAAQNKAFEKHGIVFESVGVKDYQLANWISKQSARFKFHVDDMTANLLAEHIGNDLSRIYSEFEKLKVILPPNSTITPDVVEKYIGISKEYNIFELQDALGSRNVQKTYKIMVNFSQHLKENPNIKTILMLYTFYNKMLKYHLAPDKGNDAQRQIFGNLPPSILSKNIQYAQRHTIPQLTNIISILREYDAKSKGIDTNCDEADLLKEMIYKIIH